MADITLGAHPLLKKEFVDRRFKDLTDRQFKADTLFTKTSVNALAIKFGVEDAGKDEFGFRAHDEVPEVGEGSNYKRIGLTEEQRSEMIKKYGLEAAITYEMQKFGDGAQIERAYKRLAQNVLAMVDGMAYKVATADYTPGANGTQGFQKTDNFWTGTNAADNMIEDIIDARRAIRKFGYNANTAVINPEIEAEMLKNKSIRDAFRENNTDITLMRGYIGDFMGISFLVDENFKEDHFLLVDRGNIGEIADAEAMRTKVYNEDSNDRTIVRATRFTAAYLTDPKAVYQLGNLLG
jgi:hypothetical protein